MGRGGRGRYLNLPCGDTAAGDEVSGVGERAGAPGAPGLAGGKARVRVWAAAGGRGGSGQTDGDDDRGKAEISQGRGGHSAGPARIRPDLESFCFARRLMCM